MSAEPAERFWMETTGRDVLGVDLHAPQLNGAGRPEWGYALVAETQPGDVVFYWHTSRADRPALVGWSVIIGPLTEVQDYTWMPQGLRGRARGVPTIGLGWRMPCTGFTALAQPIDGRGLAAREDQLSTVVHDLRRGYGVPCTSRSTSTDPGEVRSSQSYLTKFPSALLDVFPELALAAQPSAASPLPDAGLPVSGTSASGGGRIQDVRARVAIEQHAVSLALQYYTDLGATRVEELGKPFDLIVHGLGPTRHVEVKDSTAMPLAAAELTINEVAHAGNYQPTDLAVVDHIELDVSDADAPMATGGRLRVCKNWTPATAALGPRAMPTNCPPQRTSR